MKKEATSNSDRLKMLSKGIKEVKEAPFEGFRIRMQKRLDDFRGNKETSGLKIACNEKTYQHV